MLRLTSSRSQPSPPLVSSDGGSLPAGGGSGGGGSSAEAGGPQATAGLPSSSGAGAGGAGSASGCGADGSEGRPYFNGPNQFAATFKFEVVRKATGKPETLEEVAMYTVQGDKISQEQFFYEGEH